MNQKEFDQIKNMTYLECCDYFQDKYGIGRDDYYSPIFVKKSKVSRTAEGLFAHHKMEDRMIMLSTQSVAKLCPFEWQRKENIVYCDYLEHLWLHILICKYPSPNKVQVVNVGIGGAINFIIPDLNLFYSGYEPKQKWRSNCFNLVRNDEDVYRQMLKIFDDVIENYKCCELSEPVNLLVFLNEYFNPEKASEKETIKIALLENEQWRNIEFDAHTMWYVSNKGRVKQRRITDGEEALVKISLNQQREAVALVKGSEKAVKHLVARAFMRDEYMKYSNPIVEVIDGNEQNCDISNLRIH